MRSILIAAGLIAACALRSWSASGEPKCPGCNVILVTIDLLRADELRPVGGGKEIMPNLDALAARGIAFSEAFSPSPDTVPSSVSIINGLYPWHHGARVPLRDKAIQDDWAVNANVNAIGGILKRRGYDVRTLVVGGRSPLDRLLGKDLFLGAPTDARDLSGKMFFLLVRAAVHDPYLPAFDDVRALDSSTVEYSYPHESDVVNCELASALENKLPDSLQEFYSIKDPRPERVRPLIDGDIAHRLQAGREFSPLDTYTLSSQCFWSFFSSSTIPTARLLYDADFRAIDTALGKLMRNLEEAGLLKNTLVVVTSQHGEEFLEHGRVTHSKQLYSESLHVPFMLLFPGRSPGRVSSEIAGSVDVLPTILGALGFEAPGKLDGLDLLHCLDGGCGQRYVFAETNHAFSARDDSYSYIRYWDDGSFREELFDRRSDPGERHDISSREPQVLSRMRAAVAAQIEGLLPPSGRPWPEWVSDELREQIIKTGYW
jgi:hypothetical protein